MTPKVLQINSGKRNCAVHSKKKRYMKFTKRYLLLKRKNIKFRIQCIRAVEEIDMFIKRIRESICIFSEDFNLRFI